MANEFIIKNGYVSKGDSQVSGSLNVGTTANQGILTVTGKTNPQLQFLNTSTAYPGIVTTDFYNNSTDNASPLQIQPGSNTGIGRGSTLTLGGGLNSNLSGGQGGDVRIIGGASANTSREIGEIFISGSLIKMAGPVSGSEFSGSFSGSFTGAIGGSETTVTAKEIIAGTGTTTIDDSIHTTGAITASGNISSSGKFIGSELSSLDDLTLDADGADILLKDGGTEFGRFKRDSSNFVIKSATSDKDIIFRGDSGGGTVTSLTLDMSDAGSATFNNNITSSGDISLPNSGQSINFISNAGIYGRTGGSYPGLHIASGTSTSARIWIGNAFNTTGAVTASFLGLGQISNVHTIEPHGNYPLILRGGKGPNDANDGIQMFTGDASNVYQKRFEIEADGTNVDAYFTNINGFGINKTSGFAAELDVNGDINASGDITSSKFLGDNFVKSGGTSAQFLKADGSVDSSTYSTATGVENNADVTDATNVAAAGALMASSNLSDVGNAETSRDNLGLGSFATISSLAFSSLTGKPTTVAGYGITDAATATSTTTFTNKSGNISQWTNNSGYLTAFTVQEDGSNVETGTKKLNFAGNAVSAATDGVDKVTLTISTGSVSVTGTLPFTGSAGISGSLEVVGSGSGLFSVEGSVGTLFTVDDGLDDVIFAANNISGTPVISANADNTVKLGKLGGFGIVISGSTPAPNDDQAKIIITGSMHTSGSLGVGMAASSTVGRIDANNDVVAFSTSDERLKDNIVPIEDALNKVSQVQGIEFDWIPKEGVHGNEGRDVGVIAQEIEKVLPEVVTTRDNGYKAVKYEKIIPLLVEAIKELQEEIKELKKDK